MSNTDTITAVILSELEEGVRPAHGTTMLVCLLHAFTTAGD